MSEKPDLAARGNESSDQLVDDLAAQIEGTNAVSEIDPALKLKFAKRIYGYTQTFRSELTCGVYRKYTEALNRHFPSKPPCSPNLQAMPIHMGRMWSGHLNIFELGRQRAFTALQIEDWTDKIHNVLFGMNILRAAGRKEQQRLAALIVGGQPKQRIVAHLSQGARFLLFYLYGPLQTIGPAWSEDQPTLRDIGEGLRLAARCEADILASTNRPAEAAILVANTTEINARFFVAPEATNNPDFYGHYPFDQERMAIYTALADAQVPVDVVGEEEVIEDEILNRYKILYVADPHVETRAQRKIKAWVSAGGTLWASYAALSRQEFDEPSTLFDEVFGLKSRGPALPMPYHYGLYRPRLDPGPDIRVPEGEFFKKTEFKGLYYRPTYELATGTALAQFDGGSPAIVHNRYGKGQTFLNGFLAGLVYTGFAGDHRHFMDDPGKSADRRQIITAPASAAQVRPHVKCSRPEAIAIVHDGPRQAVVFVMNVKREPTGDFTLEALLPRKAATAYCGSKGPLDFTATAAGATVTLNLPRRGAEIVVFRY